MRTILVAVIALVSLPDLAWAFSADAHEAVCEIAYRELTTTARQRVDTLMAKETHPNIKSFRDSCVWPDFRGSIQSSRRPDHYINIPRHWTSIWYQRCYQTDRCLFVAITEDAQILSSPWTSDNEKLTALKFLGHWAGDIHQPLHVSYADDRGGNKIIVKNVSGCSYEGRTSLHSVWDKCIPRDVMQALDAADVAPDDDDREAFGQLLHDTITDMQREAWTASLSPLDWANESLAIARQADVGYCIRNGNRCDYSNTEETYEEEDHDPDEGMRIFEAPSGYEDDFNAIMTERMQMAGVRLGAMLNHIFEN